MANEIDVKAEAERIIEEPRVNTPCGKCDEQVAEIIALASRVRDEARRETVEKCLEIIEPWKNAVGQIGPLQGVGMNQAAQAIENVIRAAFAEPGKEQEQADSQPDTLRQLVDAAVAMVGMLRLNYPTSRLCAGRINCECSCCTILRLAPQFKEKTNE